MPLSCPFAQGTELRQAQERYALAPGHWHKLVCDTTRMQTHLSDFRAPASHPFRTLPLDPCGRQGNNSRPSVYFGLYMVPYGMGGWLSPLCHSRKGKMCPWPILQASVPQFPELLCETEWGSECGSKSHVLPIVILVPQITAYTRHKALSSPSVLSHPVKFHVVPLGDTHIGHILMLTISLFCFRDLQRNMA